MSPDEPSRDQIDRALRGDLPEEELERVLAHWEDRPDQFVGVDQATDPLLAAVRDTPTVRDELTHVETEVQPLVQRMLEPGFFSEQTENPLVSDHSETTIIGPAEEATIDGGTAESSIVGPHSAPVPPPESAQASGTSVELGPVHEPVSPGNSLPTQRDAQLATPVESELVPGLVLGAYKIIRKLGQGGMGLVFLAEHQRMKRLVALKVLPPQLTRQPSAIQRFQREVQALARLSHPNIVTAFDADEARGLHLLVMEFVDGTDLSVLVRKHGPLSVDRALDFIIQAARGLEYAHKRGMVHRDIKPSNILVDTEGHVKILDLGLARFGDSADAEGHELTGSGMLLGTADYMAPEQAENTKTADARADIYSLGCTLYFLLTGRTLYTGDTVLARLLAHTKQPIPSLRAIVPTLSPELDAVYQRAVAKSPEERFQTVTEYLEALSRVPTESARLSVVTMSPGLPSGVDTPTLAGDSLTTRAETSSEGRGSRSRVRMMALAAGGAALLLLAVWIIIKDRNNNEVARGEVKPGESVNPQGSAGTTLKVVNTPDGGRPADKTDKPSWHGWPADAPKPALAPFDAAQAKRHQVEWAAYLKVPVEYTNSIGMKFRLIPPGEFMMGSTAEEVEAALKDADPNDKNWCDFIKSEGPRHRVVLTQPIYLGVNEVLQSEYEKVMGVNPSHFALTGAGKDAINGRRTADHPVEMVSWYHSADFTTKLSELEKLKPFYLVEGETVMPLVGTGYRLPNEAEWEFACRAGTTTKRWIGDQDEDLPKAGWLGLNSQGRTHAAGELQANPFGLVDIHGNVWEWVQDRWDANTYGEYRNQPAVNPATPVPGGYPRVFRGGSFLDAPPHFRSSVRFINPPVARDKNIGFRVILSVDAVKVAMAERAATVAATVNWHGWPADAPKPAIAPFDATQAKKHQEEWAAYLKVPVEYTNSIGMKFRLIPPGEFTMGSTPEEIERALALVDADQHWRECIVAEGPPHVVILPKPFFLGTHEVTQANYRSVTGKNPSHFSPDGAGKEAVVGIDTSAHPVEMITWNDAAEFCARLSLKEGMSPAYSRSGNTVISQNGSGYRLPGEAQWEYSCRAGTTTRYWTGDSDDEILTAGWIAENSEGRTHAKGQLRLNPFGLADMHGNVWEWLHDGWDSNQYRQFEFIPAVNPLRTFEGVMLRSLRGGDWRYPVAATRVAYRNSEGWWRSLNNVGFRVSLSIDAVQNSEKAGPIPSDP